MALSSSFMADWGTLIPNGPLDSGHDPGKFQANPHLNQRLSTSFNRVWVSIARLNALLNSMGMSAR